MGLEGIVSKRKELCRSSPERIATAKLRRSSSAVATNREGRRLPRIRPVLKRVGYSDTNPRRGAVAASCIALSCIRQRRPVPHVSGQIMSLRHRASITARGASDHTRSPTNDAIERIASPVHADRIGATFSPAFCGSSSSIFVGMGGAFFRTFVPAAKALSGAYEGGSRACSPSSKPRSWHRR
jgi:hypothetical protein